MYITFFFSIGYPLLMADKLKQGRASPPSTSERTETLAGERAATRW